MCWGGDNAVGELNSPPNSFTQLTAGTYYLCALRSNGTTECWRYNFYGQATPPAGTFTQIAADTFHTCELRSTGEWPAGDGLTMHVRQCHRFFSELVVVLLSRPVTRRIGDWNWMLA